MTAQQREEQTAETAETAGSNEIVEISKKEYDKLLLAHQRMVRHDQLRKNRQKNYRDKKSK